VTTLRPDLDNASGGKMRLVVIITLIYIFSSSLRAEKLTIYTYDSFVSEWGPGPIVEKIFEDKYEIDLQFIAVDSLLHF